MPVIIVSSRLHRDAIRAHFGGPVHAGLRVSSLRRAGVGHRAQFVRQQTRLRMSVHPAGHSIPRALPTPHFLQDSIARHTILCDICLQKSALVCRPMVALDFQAS